jgi:hypothetical protein
VRGASCSHDGGIILTASRKALQGVLVQVAETLAAGCRACRSTAFVYGRDLGANLANNADFDPAATTVVSADCE